MVRLSILVLCALGAGCRWTREAEEVTYQQVRPEQLLRKYEWFKDAAAQLDKKRADIGVYEARMRGMAAGYGATPRTGWARPDLEQYNLWATEHAGVTSSYNALAAEYNAQMAKVNWAFCNVGDLPAGATTALPREYASYVEN